jgi:4-hydroxy-3-polyprenylbenzoate decarboxylase
MQEDIVLAFSGASGAAYGLELLRALGKERIPVRVIMSDISLRILELECGVLRDEIEGLADEVVDASVMDHPLASGSNRFSAMVICPCSTSTASKVACGIADNLTTRAASVALKERRRLIVVIRETPLSTPVLRNLYELSSYGAVIMPAAPPLYGGSSTVQDMHRSIAGRVMDLLGIENDLAPRYRVDEG